MAVCTSWAGLGGGWKGGKVSLQISQHGRGEETLSRDLIWTRQGGGKPQALPQLEATEQGSGIIVKRNGNSITTSTGYGIYTSATSLSLAQL